MPRPRGATAERFEDGLEELIAAAGPPEVPKNWGNFPTAFTAESPPDTAEPPAPDQPTPPEPADSEPPPEEPEETGGEPVEEEPASVAQLRRENEFLRLALQRPVQVQPPAELPRVPTPADARAIITEALGGFRVTPEDMVTIGFPEEKAVKAAEYCNNLVYAASGAGAAVAIKQNRYDYQVDQTQRESRTALADLMYSKHPDLRQFADQVHLEAQRVLAENTDRTGQVHITSPALVEETARRTWAKLANWGVKRPKQSHVRPLRPAFAEGGGGGTRSVPRRGLTPFERELGQLIQARG